MQYLRVVDWVTRYENNRTKDLKETKWVPIPNRHDGDGYTELMDHQNGPQHFAAWVLILQVASKCKHVPQEGATISQEGAGSPQEAADPCEVRGSLLRSDKKPHDAKSLSRVTRCPEKVFNEAIPRLIELGWLEIITVKSGFSENPAGRCDHLAVISQESAAIPQEPARNGMEWNGMEKEKYIMSSSPNIDDAHDEKTPMLDRIMKTDNPDRKSIGYGPEARAVLHILNEVAGRNFREVDKHLKDIKQRLKEPGVTVDGIRKMIERQFAMWRGTDMETYLRPSTLFNATKFAGYYDDREQPIKRSREATRAQTEDTGWVEKGESW